MNLPRRSVRPIFTILPSCTAMTASRRGEDVDPLAGARGGDGEAALPFLIRFFATALSLMSSA